MSRTSSEERNSHLRQKHLQSVCLLHFVKYLIVQFLKKFKVIQVNLKKRINIP